MKKNMTKLTLVFLITLPLLIASCGNGGSKSDEMKAAGSEQIFGDIIGPVAQYQAKLEQNEEDQKNNTDLNDAFKLAQEEKLLKEEANTKVETYFSELKEPLKATVVQEGDAEEYKITEVVLTKANFKNFMVKAMVEILNPSAMEGKGIHLQVYKGDEPTKRWLNLGCSGDADKTSNTWEFTGGTYCSFLIGATKLVAKPDSVYRASLK